MKFPKLRPQGAKVLKVPDLAGGLNLRDGVSEVLDNQLTQAKNMWFQDGVLKTRPGIYIDENQKQNNELPFMESVKIRSFSQIRNIINGEEHILQVAEKITDDCLELEFFWAGKTNSLKFGQIGVNEGNYFVTGKDGVIYVFSEYDGIYKYNYLNPDEDFAPVENKDFYTPIVLTDCKADSYDVLTKRPEDVVTSGVMYESYNLLGSAYKVQYTAFNPDIVWDRVDELSGEKEKVHRMQYFLPETPEDLKGKTVKVTHTGPKGVAEHTITFPISGSGINAETKYNEIDGLKLCATGNKILFRDPGTTDGICLISEWESSFRNNIEVTIPYEFSENEQSKIFNARECVWFGGGTAGIEGGTRLFLGGNTSKGNENLVVWSDLNNPLYFPENNYFRVGESSTAVTGFGKQADMLVIFKENGSGVFYTKYQQNTDISAEDLINQSVVDYVASSVYFPLVQINPNVGCSHPETIQLCRNRLVWLGDNGNVYTLVNESQYNERSVFCVSEMVARDLKRNISGIPTACDWNGYYCLMCGNKLYLMDYNCYGYTHIASYSKTEDANIRIPWYIWELPIKGNVSVADEILIVSFYNKGHDENTSCFLNYVISDDSRAEDVFYEYNPDANDLIIKTLPIQTSLRTKLFTFGEASTRKNIDKINLQLGNNGGEPITIKVITDQSQEEHDIYLNGTETQAYTPGYIDSKAIFPCARNVLRIGLELSSQGVIAVDGMEIKYRTTGGAR